MDTVITYATKNVASAQRSILRCNCFLNPEPSITAYSNIAEATKSKHSKSQRSSAVMYLA